MYESNNPPNIQQKRITPKNTICLISLELQPRLWPCIHWMHGVGVAYHLLHILQKFTQSRIFTTVTGSPEITGSFW